MKNVLIAIVFFAIMFTIGQVRAERSPFNENYYNQMWCEQKGGVSEFRLNDGKRVDCLLPNYAVEADWANYKSYEAIGQALHYAKETNRKVVILLIIKDEKGFKWVKLVSDNLKYYHIHKAKVWYIIANERFIYK